MSSSTPSTAADLAGLPPTPPAAVEAFGARLGLAERYAHLLVDVAEPRGLIGPREVSRLWERHLLNCAALAQVVPPGASVADLGSGAGLPGLPLAIARTDVRVSLVESRLRPVTFLREVVAELGLTGVEVWHGRAEDAAGRLRVHIVTARAVADLVRLVRWGSPLVLPGGEMVLLRGQRAEEELALAQPQVRALGWQASVETLHLAGSATSVVRVRAAKGSR